MSQVDTSLFRPELVFFDFEATDEWDFFKKMSDTLKEKGYVRDSWHDAICAREKSFPTGLQFEKIGVAIPHVDPENIVKPYIAIIKPKAPIDFAPMADMVDHPVHTELIINLGLLAHAEDQVAVLQALMNVFMSEEAVNDLLAQTTAEGMVASMTKWCQEYAE